MPVRQVALAQQVDGINLMRSKGGASASSLFDLKNGWVTSKRTIQARPGSAVDVVFPVGTKGVVGFEGKFHTFSNVAATSADARVVVNVLIHPTTPTPLLKIHKAFPFLGRLYVVAEFTDNVVKHYWLESPTAWAVSGEYSYGSIVQPTVKSGYYYENLTPSTVMAWQYNTEVVVYDIKQPRIANGFKYTVTAVTGTAPIKTSNTEPVWPTVVGGTVIERRYVTEVASPPGSTTTTGGTDPPPGSGTGSGGGDLPPEYFPYPECVASDMLLARAIAASDVRVRDEYDCHRPELGFYRGVISAVAVASMRECVRLNAGDGFILDCSTTTPFTLPGAESDLQDGMTFLAPDMLGRSVYTDDGIRVIVGVEAIGLRQVVPISFAGQASFAAGMRADKRIYSHNIRKANP